MKLQNLPKNLKSASKCYSPILENSFPDEFFQIWTLHPDRKKSLERIIRKLDKFVIHKYKPNSQIFQTDECIISIIFNWMGLIDCIDYLKQIEVQPYLKIKYTKILEDWESQVQRQLISLNKEFQNLEKVYPNLTRESFGVIIYNEKITPKTFIQNKQIYDIPKDHINCHTITKISLITDQLGNLVGCKINVPHPNAEKKGNLFCIGSLKHQKLTVDIVKELKKRFQYWNLDACYWTPKNL